MLLRSPCKNLKSYNNPFWKNSEGGGGKKRKEKKSMIIVVPSCLKDANGAHTRSDQNKTYSVQLELELSLAIKE